MLQADYSTCTMPPTRTYPYETEGDSRSATSHRSTQSSRSSVLQRAREYNRRVDSENELRAKSTERSVLNSSQDESTRSQSAGRHVGNRAPTRERAMASVRDVKSEVPSPVNNSNGTNGISRQHSRPSPTAPRSPPKPQQQQSQRRPPAQRDEPQEAVVSPELLVDALSGHEDGLLAIAERLMEHYDAGYDVMGEAIIDAFADVQKLFQHVVEAAHMEGAAFESSRREAELHDLRKQLRNQVEGGDASDVPPSPNGGSRHEEIIDQDVKDVLAEAVRLGSSLRDANKHLECYQLFEAACQNASSLLPVDSDHRGRLQLSIARAESMSPDRACAILRYAMDDVMRSGLRASSAPPPDTSKRSDMVLSKPKDLPSINGAAGQVVQSSAEALASLVEEMKEVLGAPVYDNTPLQSVAQRFWVALGEAQRSQQKNEELLEQQLGKLKGEYLMARAVRHWYILLVCLRVVRSVV